MNSKLILKDTKGMTPQDWLAYRACGVGASESAILLGLNPYKSSVELFYEKIGGPVVNLENLAMFFGTEQEPFIADLWQYWEGSPESMMNNYRAGRIVRRCQRVNAFVHNPDLPNMYCSLDRKINNYGGRGEGSLELKTISGWVVQQWEGGIVPSHIVQVQHQIMTCEFNYGELAVFKDGRDFSVYPFEKLEGVQETIFNAVQDFWGRVEKGRVLMNQQYEAKINFNGKLVNEIQAELDQLEPPPDGSDAYTNYLKEKYKNPQQAFKLGSDEDYDLARQEAAFSEQIKAIEEQKAEVQNILKKSMGDVQTLDFGAGGKLHWKLTSKGYRTFSNKTKAR